MNYQLTEDEFNKIEACCRQIDLMTDLCSYIEGQQSISIDGLQTFLCAQQEVLHAALKAASKRQEVQYEIDRTGGAMRYFDWVNALRIASGDASHTLSGAEKRITDRLALMAKADEEMQHVLNEWRTVMARAAGEPQRQLAPAEPPAKASKRARLTAGAA